MHHDAVFSGEREDMMTYILTVPRQRMISDELRRYYASVSSEYSSTLHESIARKLISIVDYNAHSYSSNQTSFGSKNTALCVIGSKIERSCAPNLSYRSTETGMLEYVVGESPIKEGDRLSFSYAPGIYELPRAIRRHFLEVNKGFTCQCERCLGFDECSPVVCVHGNGGVSRFPQWV